MMAYLLDTNVVLNALKNPSSLSPAARNAVLAGPSVISAVVYWEVVLKVMKGTLIVGQLRAWWLDTLDMLAATALPLTPDYVAKVHELPLIHNDPFDRILIAQASVEGFAVVTTDREIKKYASKRLRVIV
jgi:PIN domain nuclease of toxin-antitoxin system